MTRTLTVELPDKIMDRAEAQASRDGLSVDEFVRSALVEHIGWNTIAAIHARNVDADGDEVMELAYAELDAMRAERNRS